MKRTVLSIAILYTLATASYAETTTNVTFFGTVDAGIAYTNNGASAPNGSNTLLVSSGIMSGSRFGFLGSEDLGGGLAAIFRLEAGFDSDTGALKTYSGNPSTATPAAPGGAPVNGLFNRRSYVGLEGNFGSVSFGRDYTPLYWTAKDSDPLTLQLYGNLQEIVLLSGTGSDRFGRASNAVFYQSPNYAGFQGRAMYSLGSESAGGAGAPPADANRMWGVNGNYVTGGLLVTGAYQQIKLPTVAGTPAAFTGASGTRKDTIIGAKYTFGDFSLAGGYLQVKQPTPNSDAKDVWLGGTVKLGTGTVLANVQRMRQNAAIGDARKGTVFALAYVYPLSRRTHLYTSYGQLNNNSTASFALVAGDPSVAPGAPGANVKAIAFGIQQNF